ncbi:NAD-P-binding protein [Schizopora paradoxa]|uniref:NAD-P-binding protein n=1 Tax=Schizopora paradoxa TaxID=27342 RepID=A0A0H2SRI3_9AGAM|nr:NAD-P-binding protein [Schizopora paradoxa]
MSSTSQNLTGKVALVTGSSRGIGAAIARKLAKDGANVIVNYVSNEKAAAEVLNELNGIRTKSAVAIKADVSTFEGVKKFSAEALKAFGKVDILVLNAGILQNKVLSEVSEEDYDLVFNANVKGPLFLTQMLAPHLPEGGRVIFFSSTLAHFSSVPTNTLLYCGSKGAIEQFTRVLAKDFGPRQITVNCIAPGPIDTDMFRKDKPEQLIKFFENLHPQKRLGQPDEVSGIVALLAGPGGSWINGQTVKVNGGYSV